MPPGPPRTLCCTVLPSPGTSRAPSWPVPPSPRRSQHLKNAGSSAPLPGPPPTRSICMPLPTQGPTPPRSVDDALGPDVRYRGRGPPPPRTRPSPAVPPLLARFPPLDTCTDEYGLGPEYTGALLVAVLPCLHHRRRHRRRGSPTHHTLSPRDRPSALLAPSPLRSDVVCLTGLPWHMAHAGRVRPQERSGHRDGCRQGPRVRTQHPDGPRHPRLGRHSALGTKLRSANRSYRGHQCVCLYVFVCVCVYGEKGVEVGFLMVTVVMACAEGAREETMTGLAGIGDVMLTCFGGPDTPRLLVWRVSSRGITRGCHCQA